MPENYAIRELQELIQALDRSLSSFKQEMRDNLLDIRTGITERDTEKEDLESRLNYAEAKIADLEASYEDLNGRFLSEKTTMLDHYFELRERIEKLEVLYNNITSQKFKELETSIEAVSNFLDLARDDIAEVKERLDKERKQLVKDFAGLITIESEEEE